MKRADNFRIRPTHQGRAMALALASGFLATSGITRADTQVFSENFDTDQTANWTVNSSGGNNPVDFFFDYSTVGIPSAPNSGGTTRGLKMQANQGVGIFSGVSVSPNGLNLSGSYEMRFDMWLNYNGPLNGGGSGSTQVTGAGIGTAGTSAVWPGAGDCVWFMTSGDGGSSVDYRAYTPGDVLAPDASPVYAAGAHTGNRNNSDPYYSSFGGLSAPAAQVTLYPGQTGTSAVGSQGFAWHDVRIKRVIDTVTWTIDGTLIATVDVPDASLGGGNILFDHSDINATSSTDVNSTNLLFGLIDNVRITNFTGVSVSAPIPTASESGPTSGLFTLTRTDSGSPLTVNITVGGTAQNGVDYTNELGTAIPSTITFAAGDLTTNISVIPIDDSIAELTETVILTVTSGAGYVGVGSATVEITDNDTPTIDLAPGYLTMYERLTNDYASFKLTRRGDLNAANFDVNFSDTGSAGAYQPVGTVTFEPGMVTNSLHVHPYDNSTLDGPRSVTITIAAAGAGEYAIGTNDPVTANIVDDETPPETVLWSDPLTNDTSANWTMLAGSTNSATINYTTNWAYDYSVDTIPAAPHSGGDTHGLKMTVNKTAGGGAAGINFYPSGQTFGGNYALRFDMYLATGPSTFTTELALFGLNHDSLHTNWFKNSGVPAGWTFDGLWCWIEADGAAQYSGGDYRLNGAATGTAPALLAGDYATNWVATFKSPPWADYINNPSVYGYAGVPANVQTLTTTPCWADVELRQIGKIVTLTIDRTTILSYTNNSGPVTGNIMLGYDDPADSVGPAASSVIYANARVISLAAPVISAIAPNGANIEISFTANSGDVPDQFVLQQSSPSVLGSYDDTTSTITSPSAGVFKAVKPLGVNPTFYRIRRVF